MSRNSARYDTTGFAEAGEQREVPVQADEQRSGLDGQGGEVGVGDEVAACIRATAESLEQREVVAAGVEHQGVRVRDQRADEGERLVVRVGWAETLAGA